MTGRRSRSLTVASSQRTGVESVGRETSDCERSRLGRELGEGGGGGGAGEGVARDDSILLGDRLGGGDQENITSLSPATATNFSGAPVGTVV